MELTFKEHAVLKTIRETIEDTWCMSSDVLTYTNLPEKVVIGTIGILTRKGLIECDCDEGVDWVKITDRGHKALSV